MNKSNKKSVRPELSERAFCNNNLALFLITYTLYLQFGNLNYMNKKKVSEPSLHTYARASQGGETSHCFFFLC